MIREDHRQAVPLFDIADLPPLLDAEQAARLLNISPKTLYGWAKLKKLPCIRLGRRVRFKADVIREIHAGRRDLEGGLA